MILQKEDFERKYNNYAKIMTNLPKVIFLYQNSNILTCPQIAFERSVMINCTKRKDT